MARCCCALVSLVVCGGTAVGNVIHLYRFEDSPGFLGDCTRTADLEIVGTASQVALSDTGRGSAFLRWDGGNQSAADIIASTGDARKGRDSRRKRRRRGRFAPISNGRPGRSRSGQHHGPQTARYPLRQVKSALVDPGDRDGIAGKARDSRGPEVIREIPD